MPWNTFFTVEALTLSGLVPRFVVDIETRRVQIAGIVRQPRDAWMK